MQKHTVILYNPRSVFYTMPLALLAIGSYLDKERYDVVIVDGRLEKDPLEKIFAAINPATICFAVTVLTGKPIEDALLVSASVKNRFPHIPVIWGGWHPSLFPGETLENANVDIIVKGQGEISFAEVLEHLINKQSLAGVAGIGYKENNRIVINADRHLSDINLFPP